MQFTFSYKILARECDLVIDRIDNLLSQLVIERIAVELHVFLVDVGETSSLILSGHLELVLRDIMVKFAGSAPHFFIPVGEVHLLLQLL